MKSPETVGCRSGAVIRSANRSHKEHGHRGNGKDRGEADQDALDNIEHIAAPVKWH